MSKQDSSRPFYCQSESLPNLIFRKCMELCELFPETTCKHLQIFLRLIVKVPWGIAMWLSGVASIRLTTTRELQELEEFRRQEQKKFGWYTRISNLGSQLQSQYSDDSNQMYNSNYSRSPYAYKIMQQTMFSSCTSLEMNYAMALELLVDSNYIIQKQDGTIRDVNTENKCLATEVGELQSTIKSKGYNSQTAKACQSNTERSLAKWKQDYIPFILSFSCELVSSFNLDNKKLQKKEFYAASRKHSKKFGGYANGEAMKQLWKAYKSWESMQIMVK